MIRQENKIKETHIGKEEVKLSLITDDMFVYKGEPKDSTKRQLELFLKEFGKVAAC